MLPWYFALRDHDLRVEVATVIKENEPQQSEAQAVEEGGAMITGLVKQLSSTMARQLSL